MTQKRLRRKPKVKEQLSPFTIAVIAVIQKIPKARAATYGQIAGLANRPGASRGVVWILHSLSKAYALPWHRVVNSKGQIAFAPDTYAFIQQRRRLVKEGVEVTADGQILLSRFQWKKKPTLPIAPVHNRQRSKKRIEPQLFRG